MLSAKWRRFCLGLNVSSGSDNVMINTLPRAAFFFCGQAKARTHSSRVWQNNIIIYLAYLISIIPSKLFYLMMTFHQNTQKSLYKFQWVWAMKCLKPTCFTLNMIIYCIGPCYVEFPVHYGILFWQIVVWWVSVIMYIDQASMCFVIGRRESYPQLYFINTLPVMNLIQFHHIRCIMACLRITFVCLHITQYHYHHCANVFECIEHVCQVNSAMCVTKINSKVQKLNGQLMAEKDFPVLNMK